MSTHNQDAVITVAAAPTLALTVGEAERQLRALFAAHRPTDRELAAIGIFAALATEAVARAYERASAAPDAATLSADYTNCAALYGYVLGCGAASRAPR